MIDPTEEDLWEERERRLFWRYIREMWWMIAAAVLLIVAILPIGWNFYYEGLRWIIFVLCWIMGYRCDRTENLGSASLTFTLGMVLFWPFSPLTASKTFWTFVDLILAIAFIQVGWELIHGVPKDWKSRIDLWGSSWRP